MGFRDLATRPLYRLYEDRLLAGLDRTLLPGHVGVIHDGHRRYARSEGLPDYAASYRVGMAKFIEFLHWTDELEIDAVTCWLLSKENLQRPDEELVPYYEVLKELFEQIPTALDDHNVGVRFIGSLDLLPPDLVAAAKQLEEQMPDGERRLTIALAYGGRQEIVDAVRDLVGTLAEEGLDGDQLAGRFAFLGQIRLSLRPRPSSLAGPPVGASTTTQGWDHAPRFFTGPFLRVSVRSVRLCLSSVSLAWWDLPGV